MSLIEVPTSYAYKKCGNTFVFWYSYKGRMYLDDIKITIIITSCITYLEHLISKHVPSMKMAVIPISPSL